MTPEIIAKKLALEVAAKMKTAIEFAFKLPETKAWKKVGAEFGPMDAPGCESAGPMGSRPFLRCYAKRAVTVAYGHLAGTAAFGKGKGDPNAVVDSKLRYE